ncbi:DUF2442 domain-containing protein [Sulfuriflexus sp.]|uniref:DUF2442 domain-containing protein n=1 Tax=Sulfuriflexus sp. TaxID=2015443 RepID=UPI0028CF2A47|nr:DUF2442 domain-containing protein [Sulfuriflexus sp.]MDT8404537.1 DUF2442 domain-containing protein [Sulfuriflexus sp.]
MSTLAVETHPLAQSVEFTDDDLIVSLLDGRKVTVPLVWFPRLSEATKTQLERYELLADGEGIHWPEIDEDLSVAGLLRGDH